jgi:hypothetical protein
MSAEQKTIDPKEKLEGKWEAFLLAIEYLLPHDLQEERWLTQHSADQIR